MPVPDATVIIGAYNAMPYLTRCLTSAIDQSIGRHRMEIVAVNDGSTDGTGAELDRLAAAHPGLIRVIHQENSGGPSAPRNLALDHHARGRYVFFLDADDHLGPEALERMVATADANGTDVVVGRIVGIGGRRAPSSMFRRNQPRTDVFNSRVYWTLNPIKLFRRDLIEQHRLRFPTEHKIGEDLHFTARAYLHAAGISVLADYACVYWVARDDGQNITNTQHGTELRIRALTAMADLIDTYVEPGPGHDHLMHRHLTVELRDTLIHIHQEPRRSDQEKALDQLRELLGRCYHEGIADRLPALAWLRCHLIERGLLDELLELVRFEIAQGSTCYGIPVQNGTAGTGPYATRPEILFEGGRAYAGYPYFRDPERAVPDRGYDITRELRARHRLDSAEIRGCELRLTGHAYLRGVSTEALRTELVLRERGSGSEYRVAAERTATLGLDAATPGLGADEDNDAFSYPMAGFAARVDLMRVAGGSRLPDGLWDVYLAIRVEQFTREIRLGSHRSPGVASRSATHVLATGEGALPVTLYSTKPHGNLTLDIGEIKHPVAPLLRVTKAAWSQDTPGTLLVSGRCELAGFTPGALTVRLSNAHGATRDVPVATPAPGGTRFTAPVALTALPPGDWTLSLHLGANHHGVHHAGHHAGGGEDRGADPAPSRGPCWDLPVTARPKPAPARWRRHMLPWYAKPVPSAAGLTLRIDRIHLLKALRSRLRR